MNTPVNFELAKLLKEKGFKEKCNGYWYESIIQGKQSLNITYPRTRFEDWYTGEILAPTIAEVVMWLYEKHGIWINVSITIQKEYFYNCADITGKKDPTKNNYPSVISKSGNYYNSPTEAYEAGIKYTLNNLI